MKIQHPQHPLATPVVTTYAGFSSVSGTLSLESFFDHIASGTHKHLVQKINQLIQAGFTGEAGNVKRQLPFFTITAHYAEKRLPESIRQYNDLITIDIDGLTSEQVVNLRPRIEQDPATVGCFLTARRHGFKIIAYLASSRAGELRAITFGTPTVEYDELESYHSQMYEITRRHYEELLGVKVDTSGKDISRGIFASHDPQAFFSPQRAAAVPPPATHIVPPPPATRRGPKTQLPPATGKQAQPNDRVAPAVKLEFNKCVIAVRRTIAYEEGSHNPFLFALGNKCFKRGMDEDDAKQLARQRFGDNGKWDTDTPIANGYTYTDKTEKAEKKKDERRPAIEQVKEFLDTHYLFRRNMLLERLEFAELPAPDGHTFRAVSTRDINTVFFNMGLAGITYPFNSLKAVIDSNYAKPYQPFEEYFNALPAWDGVTDYIAQLADTIQTTDQPYWHLIFRRWLVGMVASAIETRHINHLTLLICGSQGKGKSTWIRNLLPPALREYYHTGVINPTSKDDKLLLAHCMLINIDEFEGGKQADAAALKRIITQESVTVRKPWEVQMRTYPRLASFIGSTNSARFLNDISGSRRFLVIRSTHIDYRREVNYEGVYSQVVSLINSGFRYWFEGEEINEINSRNEQHRMKDPIEENLYVYFQPATKTDSDARWKPAAAILSYLSTMGRTQANVQSQQLLVQILERDGFAKRTSKNGVTEYCVNRLSMEEIEQKATQCPA